MSALVNSTTTLVDADAVLVNDDGTLVDPTPDPGLATWRADISGTTYEFESYSLRVTKRVNERTAPQFDLYTDDGVHFRRGEPVKMWHNSTLVAAGMVWTAAESYWGPTEGLRHRITVVDWHVLADRRKVARGYEPGTTVGAIVRDIADILAPDGVVQGSIHDGPALSGQSGFNYVPCSQALDALAERAGYWWQITDNRVLEFLPYTARNAPWDVTPDGDGVLQDVDAGTLTAVPEAPDYRNRQYLRGVRELTDQLTERYRGDGETQTFSVAFPIAQVPTVTVNGSPQSVGIRGIDSGRSWYWNKSDRTVSQDPSEQRLGASDTLQVVYVGQFTAVIVSQDDDQIAARATVEDVGSGIWDHVASGTDVDGRAEAFALASSMLAYYGREGRRVSYRTSRPGIKPGQLQTVTAPRLGLDGLEVLVESVTYEPDGPRLRWKVEGVAGPLSHSWSHYFGQIQRQPRDFVVRENMSEDDVLTRLFEFEKTWTAAEDPNIFRELFPAVDLMPAASTFPMFDFDDRLTHVELWDADGALLRKVLTQRVGLDTATITTTQYVAPQEGLGQVVEVVWFGGVRASGSVGSGVEVGRAALVEEKTSAEAWTLVRTDSAPVA